MKKGLVILLYVVFCSIGYAYDSSKEDRKDTYITLYTDFTLVEEHRKLNMENNDFTLKIQDIPSVFRDDFVYIGDMKVKEFTFLNGEENIKNIAQVKIEPNSNKNEFELMYETEDMLWATSHIICLKKNNKLDWDVFLMLNNLTGVDYDNANIKFVISDTKSGNNDLQFYNLSDQYDLQNKTKKRVPILSRKGIECENRYVYLSENNKTVQTVTIVKNISGNILPGGKLKIYNEDKNGKELMFFDEKEIGKIEKDGALRIITGNEEDIKADLNKIKSEKINETLYENQREFIVRNHKSKTIQIDLIYKFDGKWDMIEHSDKYTKEDENTVVFTVDVLANSTKKVKFKYTSQRGQTPLASNL